MKQLLIIAALLIGFASCRKEVSYKENEDMYMRNVQTNLKDSMHSSDYGTLDFSKAVQSRINDGISYLRIPFKGKLLREEFVLLETNDLGKILKGRMVSLSPRNEILNKPYTYDGAITIRSLKGNRILKSEIINGYILAFNSQYIPTQQPGLVAPDPIYKELPEVVVVAYRSSEGVLSYSDLIHLRAVFGSGYGSWSNYYSSIEGVTGDGNGGGGGSAGNGTPQNPPILIDFENQDTDPAIQIQKYLDCFSSIPDDGATCTIEILADIAVDGDPTIFFNWDTRSPGHVFLKINKTNGSQSVQQSFGWYPKVGYKTVLTTAPITGKFVDNQRHEYNAAYTMDITPSQLQSAITRIIYLSRFIKYDVDEYNCVDFALDIFNNTVSPYDALEIPKYNLPGTTTSFGSSTPNGLYQKLQSIKQAGDAKATKVNIPGVKGWVGSSDGPCN